MTTQHTDDHGNGRKETPAGNSFNIQKPRVDRIQIDTKFALPDGGTMLIDAGRTEEHVRCESKLPLLSQIPRIGRLFPHERLEHKASHVYFLVTPKVLCVDDAADKQGGEVVRTCCDNECSKLAERAKLAPPPIALPPAATAAAVSLTPLPPHPATSDAPRVVVISPGAPPFVFGPAVVQQAQALNALGGGVAVAPAAHHATASKSAVEQRAEKKAAKLVQKYHEACANGEGEKARKYARQALDLDPTCFGKTLIQQTYQRMPRPADDVLQVFEAPIPAAPVLPR